MLEAIAAHCKQQRLLSGLGVHTQTKSVYALCSVVNTLHTDSAHQQLNVTRCKLSQAAVLPCCSCDCVCCELVC